MQFYEFHTTVRSTYSSIEQSPCNTVIQQYYRYHDSARSDRSIGASSSRDTVSNRSFHRFSFRAVDSQRLLTLVGIDPPKRKLSPRSDLLPYDLYLTKHQTPCAQHQKQQEGVKDPSKMTAGAPFPQQPRPYTWDETRPPPETLRLWTEVGNGIDKSQTGKFRPHIPIPRLETVIFCLRGTGLHTPIFLAITHNSTSASSGGLWMGCSIGMMRFLVTSFVPNDCALLDL